MDLDLYGAAARGLRRYVWLVADALGVGPGCCSVQLESPVHAYIPLDDRLPTLPGSDIAVTWDPERGWAAGAENGPEVVSLAVLGGEVLPPPATVVEFVRRFLAGEPAAKSEPRSSPDALIDRLAAYASFREGIRWAYQPHDRTTGDRGLDTRNPMPRKTTSSACFVIRQAIPSA